MTDTIEAVRHAVADTMAVLSDTHSELKTLASERRQALCASLVPELMRIFAVKKYIGPLEDGSYFRPDLTITALMEQEMKRVQAAEQHIRFSERNPASLPAQVMAREAVTEMATFRSAAEISRGIFESFVESQFEQDRLRSLISLTAVESNYDFHEGLVADFDQFEDTHNAATSVAGVYLAMAKLSARLVPGSENPISEEEWVQEAAGVAAHLSAVRGIVDAVGAEMGEHPDFSPADGAALRPQ